MTTKEKIKKYIDFKGISKNKFYVITGLSTSFLDSGNTIGVDKAKIIIEKFPDLSLEWLVMDRGPMLREEPPETATPTVVYARDPRDIELIETQRELIALLKRGKGSEVLRSARTADYVSPTGKRQ